MAIEPEIGYLVLFLVLVCKLYPSHVTKMMTSLMVIFCQEVCLLLSFNFTPYVDVEIPGFLGYLLLFLDDNVNEECK